MRDGEVFSIACALTTLGPDFLNVQRSTLSDYVNCLETGTANCLVPCTRTKGLWDQCLLYYKAMHAFEDRWEAENRGSEDFFLYEVFLTVLAKLRYSRNTIGAHGLDWV